MKRSSPRKSHSYAVLAALSAAVAVSLPLLLIGCGLQGEGERCDRNTNVNHQGNEDCTAPLVCTPQAQLAGVSSDICCPPGQGASAVGPSTSPNCQPGTNNGTGGSGSTTSTTATTGSGTTSATTSTGSGTTSATTTSTGSGTTGATTTSTGTGATSSTSTGAGGAGGGP